jgi:hypothetical protein
MILPRKDKVEWLLFFASPDGQRTAVTRPERALGAATLATSLTELVDGGFKSALTFNEAVHTRCPSSSAAQTWRDGKGPNHPGCAPWGWGLLQMWSRVGGELVRGW